MNKKLLDIEFLIIGAQKAGTSTLHDWLKLEKKICLPRWKETHFFSDNAKYDRGFEWYIKQFEEKKSEDYILGEIDPEYLYCRNAPQRIEAQSRVNKFIAILREPISRAYSHYRMSVSRGFEKLSFQDAIETEGERLRDMGQFASDHFSYLDRSYYSPQIKLFQSHFPDAQFLFIKFDDFIDPKKTMEVRRAICDFIGVDFSYQLRATLNASNQAYEPRSAWLRDVIYETGMRHPMRSFLGRFLSEDFKMWLATCVDELNRKPLSGSQKDKFVDFYITEEIRTSLMADIKEVELLTGLNLSNWEDLVSRKIRHI